MDRLSRGSMLRHALVWSIAWCAYKWLLLMLHIERVSTEITYGTFHSDNSSSFSVSNYSVVKALCITCNSNIKLMLRPKIVATCRVGFEVLQVTINFVLSYIARPTRLLSSKKGRVSSRVLSPMDSWTIDQVITYSCSWEDGTSKLLLRWNLSRLLQGLQRTFILF